MPLGTWGTLYIPWGELTHSAQNGSIAYDSSESALKQMTPADVAELAPTEETTLWVNP